MKAGQAPQMQASVVWMPILGHGSGPARAGRPLEPGSRETDLESVFGEPGSRGARKELGYLLLRARGEQEVCNQSLSGARTGWTETRTKQIAPACKQPGSEMPFRLCREENQTGP